jgi:hypothetical protein
MVELLGEIIQAFGLVIESLAGEIEQLLTKKSKRRKSTENWVAR